MSAEKMRLSSLSDANPSASHTLGEGDVKADGLEGKSHSPLNGSVVAVSISNMPQVAPARPDTTDSYKSAGSGSRSESGSGSRSGHRGSGAIQDTRGVRGGRGQYGSRSRPRSDPSSDTREKGGSDKGSDAECEDWDSEEDDGGDDWVDTRSMMKSKASHYISSSSSSSSPSLDRNAAPIEAAQLVAVAATESSTSRVSKLSGGTVSDIAVPALDSKLELSLPSDLISDNALSLKTESSSVFDSTVLGSTASVPPSNILPIENGHIPVTDVVCVGPESQHQLSGSLLTGRSGAANRKKPTARTLQPRAVVLDSSI
jgi:hypothetical protein